MLINSREEVKRLLLIDDDPHLVLLVKDFMELGGYEVKTAANGLEGLQFLEEEMPHLIICDVMMPEMDGYAFAKRVKTNPLTKSIPLIFLSAKAKPEQRIEGLNIGADVYMTKPFDLDELVAQVNALLRLVPQGQSYGEANKKTEIPKATSIHLTPTELKVLEHLALGLLNQEIAKALEVSPRTIESHVSNILGKAGLRNRTELARWYRSRKSLPSVSENKDVAI